MPKAKGRCAVFCIVQDESVFLPIWLRYHSRYFDGSDIYVLDHDTRDGSTDGLAETWGCNVTRVHHPLHHDNAFLLDVRKEKQKELLESYTYVLCSDADELVVPDPKTYDGLGEYLDRATASCIACTSRSVIHAPWESDIRLDQPILSQREYWFREKLYDKPLLSRVPLNWTIGLHYVYEEDDDNLQDGFKDDELILLHLHRMDFALSREKHERSLQKPFGASNGFSQQWTISGDAFVEWFYNPHSLGEEVVPERFKGVV